jgi:hypothetical protein
MSLVENLSCADLYALAEYCNISSRHYFVLMNNAAKKLPKTEERRKIVIKYSEKKSYYDDLQLEFEEIIEKRLMVYHNELFNK